MSRKTLIIAAVLAIIAVIIAAAGCSSSTTTSSSGASNAQAVNQQSGQQPQQGQGIQGAGQRGPGIDNSKLLARVAEILNVSFDKLTTAFNNAMPRRTEGDRTGTPPSRVPADGSGTPPTGTPPGGNGTPPGGTPPADGQQGQPAQPGQFTLPDDVIQKIASELGLSADTVSSAFKQAMSELQPSSTK